MCPDSGPLFNILLSDYLLLEDSLCVYFPYRHPSGNLKSSFLKKVFELFHYLVLLYLLNLYYL